MTTNSLTIPYILTGSGVTVYLMNKPYTVKKTEQSFKKVLEVLKDTTKTDEAKVVQLRELLDTTTKLKAVTGSGRFSFDENSETLLLDGKTAPSAITSKVVALFHNGLDISPVLNFLNKLQENPSYRSVECLYGFLEANNIPFTPDGDFLVFKKVRNDYKDYYTGTMDNSVGKVVEVNRNQVDENPDQTCSKGLHVCAEHYLNHYHGNTGRVVVCKVNPADVVAVPRDYNNSKMRVRRYEVVSEIPESDAAKYFAAPVMNGTHYVDEGNDDKDYYSADTLDYVKEDYDPDTDLQVGEGKTIEICGLKVDLTLDSVDEDEVQYTFHFVTTDSRRTCYYTYFGRTYEDCLNDFVEDHVAFINAFLVEVLGVTKDGEVIRDDFVVQLEDGADDGGVNGTPNFTVRQMFNEKYSYKAFTHVQVTKTDPLGTTYKLVMYK